MGPHVKADMLPQAFHKLLEAKKDRVIKVASLGKVLRALEEFQGSSSSAVSHARALLMGSHIAVELASRAEG